MNIVVFGASGATGSQVIDLMFELNRERGTTLLLVTHDEALSARCDRVLRLAAGQLVRSDEMKVMR